MPLTLTVDSARPALHNKASALANRQCQWILRLTSSIDVDQQSPFTQGGQLWSQSNTNSLLTLHEFALLFATHPSYRWNRIFLAMTSVSRNAKFRTCLFSHAFVRTERAIALAKLRFPKISALSVFC
jgi:hypothetical protein